MRYTLLLIFLFVCVNIFAKDVPMSVKNECALKINEAFCLQQIGQSTLASYKFNEGYQQALQAGASPRKLHAIHRLFYWYRQYGHYLKLFLKDPAGRNIITDEYQGRQINYQLSHFRKARDYKDDADTAALARDFIFGVGEVIGGLLCVYYLPGVTFKGAGLELAVMGADRMWGAFNQLKAKNDAIALETRHVFNQIKEAAKTSSEKEGW